jgi:hypothetical protein
MQPRPVVNVEEFIVKTVGRRVPNDSGEALEDALKQESSSQTRKICPRGVYRFHSHEEADAWMERMRNRVWSN